MLANLKRALNEKKISIKAYASILGISEKTAWNKVNENTALTFQEAVLTKKELFPEYDYEYLFASDGKTEIIKEREYRG